MNTTKRPTELEAELSTFKMDLRTGALTLELRSTEEGYLYFANGHLARAV
jgi:hypothetical protein